MSWQGSVIVGPIKARDIMDRAMRAGIPFICRPARDVPRQHEIQVLPEHRHHLEKWMVEPVAKPARKPRAA